MSFFDKLKKGAGIEIEEETEEIEEVKKEVKEVRKKPSANKPKKLGPKNTEETKPSSLPASTPERQAGKEASLLEGELAVDLYETEQNLVIQAAIAGVPASALDIAFDNDVLSISGERQKPEAEESAKYLCQECYWGPFSRKVILPEEVDASKAEATIKQGILTIKAPRLQRKIKKLIVKEE